jgi:hypothetical protein
MIVVGGWPGRNVVGLNGRFGVRPADFAALGDFPSPLADDADLPGDATTEFVAVVQSLPGSGTVVFDDFGGFQHTGAADGTYTTTFRLVTWAQGGPVTEHSPLETITTSFGVVPAAGVTLTAVASLIAGTASGGVSATAAGVTLAASAGLLPGAAAGQVNATAAGRTLAASAALLAGTASGAAAGTAPGALLTAAASLVAGSATAPDGTAPGVVLTAAAQLLPGAAVGPTSATAVGVVLSAAASGVWGSASSGPTSPPWLIFTTELPPPVVITTELP